MRRRRGLVVSWLLATLACSDRTVIGDEGDDEAGAAHCEAPCALVVGQQLQAISLADPEQAGVPLVLLTEEADFTAHVMTPWGSVIVTELVEGLTPITKQWRIDPNGDVEATQFLPDEAPGVLDDWIFGIDGKVACVEGDDRVWAARFAEGEVVEFASVEGMVGNGWYLTKLDPEGRALAFSRQGGLYVTSLTPEIGSTIKLPSMLGVDAFVWAGDYIVAESWFGDPGSMRLEAWSFAEPMAPGIVIEEYPDGRLRAQGNLVSYYVQSWTVVRIADIAAGTSASMPDVDWDHWVRDGVMLVGDKETEALTMVEFTGVLPGPRIPIRPLGLEVIEAVSCDAIGHWCGYGIETVDDKQIEVVDVSGPAPQSPIVVLDDLAPGTEAKIEFVEANRAVIRQGLDAEGRWQVLHVVEFESGSPSVMSIAPPAGQQMRFAEFASGSDLLVFVTHDVVTGDDFLWRARADGSDVRQVGSDTGQLIAAVFVLE